MLSLLFLAMFGLVAHADDQLTHDPTDRTSEVSTEGVVRIAKVFFIEPKDGAVTSSKIKVKMGVEGIKIRPAGEAPEEMTSGHHHLLIDSESTPAGQAIGSDEKHLHFGKGQTETEINLKPGKHTLTLQFADGAHRSFGKKMSQTIHITVK